MKIIVAEHANCGTTPIPRDEYWVNPNAEAGEITLSRKVKPYGLRQLKNGLTPKQGE